MGTDKRKIDLNDGRIKHPLSDRGPVPSGGFIRRQSFMPSFGTTAEEDLMRTRNDGLEWENDAPITGEIAGAYGPGFLKQKATPAQKKAENPEDYVLKTPPPQGMGDQFIADKAKSVNVLMKRIKSPFFATCSSKMERGKPKLVWRKYVQSCETNHKNISAVNERVVGNWLMHNYKLSLTKFLRDPNGYEAMVMRAFESVNSAAKEKADKKNARLKALEHKKNTEQKALEEKRKVKTAKRPAKPVGLKTNELRRLKKAGASEQLYNKVKDSFFALKKEYNQLRKEKSLPGGSNFCDWVSARRSFPARPHTEKPVERHEPKPVAPKKETVKHDVRKPAPRPRNVKTTWEDEEFPLTHEKYVKRERPQPKPVEPEPSFQMTEPEAPAPKKMSVLEMMKAKMNKYSGGE